MKPAPTGKLTIRGEHWIALKGLSCAALVPETIPVALGSLCRTLLYAALSMAACNSLLAGQAPAPITVRMLDSKTGLLIATSNFLVRINHQQDAHGDWVRQNEDGTGKMTLPSNSTMLSIHATYESATLIYANCDADKDRGSAEHAPGQDHWYSVADILSSGVVAPNNCIGRKVPEKLQVIAKPGEFVFFVRPLNSRERFTE
jgi:hypothetical protein